MDMNAPIKSPCILVCSIEPKSGHCFGCGRTSDEIMGWISYSPMERDTIMADLPERVAKLDRPPRRVTKRAQMRGEARRRDTLDLSS